MSRRPAPVPDILDPLELAWAAGFLDGEGYFAAAKDWRSNAIRFRASAAQCDRRPLDRLQRAVGGHVSGPYQSKHASHAPHWQWFGGWLQTSLLIQFLSEPKLEQLDSARTRAADHRQAAIVVPVYRAPARIVYPELGTRSETGVAAGVDPVQGQRLFP